MTEDVSGRLARLRGSLEPEEPGSRGLERVARNPGCQRLRAITMVGLTPAGVVKQLYREDPREGQSPFAIGAGNRFERQLFADQAMRLLALYQQKGRLRASENRVVVIPELARGVSREAMLRRRALTDDLFLRKLRGDPDAPNLIVKGRVPVPLLGVPHDTEPDALVAADDELFYRPVEVKSYPDRAGKTDSADIRSSCRQAAVAVIGLRAAVERLGGRGVEEIVPARGDLVLRQPGSMGATLRPMTLAGEVASLARALDEAPRNLDELEALLADLGPGATLDDLEVLESIPNRYQESCREHCALAPQCKRAAAAAGDPVLLGSPAREALAATGSIQRALELMTAPSPRYRTREEEALGRLLREADEAYRTAVGA